VIVAHHRRWDADFQFARACLASGEIGDPLRIKFVHWQYSSEISPDVDCDNDLLPEAHWRNEIATGGGVLWELGIHRLDQLLLLARDEPVSVYARIDKAATCSVDTGFLAVIRFASGIEAHIELNRGIAAPLETGWVIAASHGSYAAETRFTVTGEGEIVDVPVAASPVCDDFHAAVARHLRHEGPNPAPLAEARKTIALIEAVRVSARTGLPVTLNG
jgi:predicted dehydrogenase